MTTKINLEELFSSPEIQVALDKTATAIEEFLSKQENREELIKQIQNATPKHLWSNIARSELKRYHGKNLHRKGQK